MSDIRKPLTVEEICASLAGDLATKYPPILSPKQFADLVGVARATILNGSRADGCKTLPVAAENTF